jgi:hypothetical protein
MLFGAAYLGSPYWAARQFRAAALSADVDQLEAAVDFPAVRESLKSQMTVALTMRMNSDPEMKSNPFSGLGMMLIPTMVNTMIDGFVTPQGIATMVRQGKLAKAAAAQPADPSVTYDYEYRGLDRFTVTARTPSSKSADVPKFVFERRGLFAWKMIRLEIPNTALMPIT